MSRTDPTAQETHVLLMKKRMIMSCLVILSLLMIFLNAESPKDHEPNRVERIPLDEKGPLVPILQSHIQFCEPLKKCYDTEELKIHRRYCFDPPPPGHIYHCSDDVKENTAVEFFYKRFPCRKGKYASPEIKDGNVFLSCKQCPEDRFNPELRWSPENMDQCKAHYHKPLDEHAIEYLPGNRTHPAVSYCNFREGWASENEELFCRESYKPCNCAHKGDSCGSLELLSDGTCRSWCDGQRLPENEFQCTRVTEAQAEESSQVSGVSFSAATTPIPLLSTLKDAEPSTELTMAEVSKESDLSPGAIVGIVILGGIGVCLLVGAGTTIYKERCFDLHIYNNTTNVRGDYYHVNGGQEVNVEIHGRDEAALGNESE